MEKINFGALPVCIPQPTTQVEQLENVFMKYFWYKICNTIYISRTPRSGESSSWPCPSKLKRNTLVCSGGKICGQINMAFPWCINLSQLPWYIDLLQRCRTKLRQSYSYTCNCTTLCRTTPTCSHNFPHPGRIACCPAPNSRPPATKALLHTKCGNNTSIISSPWWWAYKCLKHVKQITSAINHSVASRASSWFSSEISL